MPPLPKDQAFLRSAVDELEAYLLSSELYWQMTPVKQDRGVRNLMSLTPGNLMISLIKIKNYPWGEAERATFEPLLKRIEVEISKWRSAWRKKVERELTARLKQWQDYLAEVDTDDALVDYSFKVRNRAILDCFDPRDASLNTAQNSLLNLLDDRLKRLTVTGEFVWEPEVAGGFKPDVFWYLYRQPGKG